MTFGTITTRWMHHGWRGAMPVVITYRLVCTEMEQDAGNKLTVQWRKFLVFFYRCHCGDQGHHDSAGGFCSALMKLFFLGERHWTRCLRWLHGASTWCSGDDFPEWICMDKGCSQIWQARAWQNITDPLPWRSLGGIGAISSSFLVWHHLGKEERMCLCAFCAKHLEKGPPATQYYHIDENASCWGTIYNKVEFLAAEMPDEDICFSAHFIENKTYKLYQLCRFQHVCFQVRSGGDLHCHEPWFDSVTGPLIFVRNFHPHLIKWCTLHVLNLGILYTCNGASLWLGSCRLMVA